ncbi:MAG: hypothetical protein AAF978_02830 [Cyanobacteria bacterium P01_E01_bin.48]
MTGRRLSPTPEAAPSLVVDSVHELTLAQLPFSSIVVEWPAWMFRIQRSPKLTLWLSVGRTKKLPLTPIQHRLAG